MKQYGDRWIISVGRLGLIFGELSVEGGLDNVSVWVGISIFQNLSENLKNSAYRRHSIS